MSAEFPQPLVTIGIPTWNRARTYLPDALGSAIGQTYRNLEILVSDNDSSDETEAVVKNCRDPRVRYFRHHPQVMPHESADYCLRQARGAYFLLLHDDDRIDEDFIEACIDGIGGRDVGFAHTGARVIDGRGEVLRERANLQGDSSRFDYLDAILRGGGVTYFCNTLYNTKHLRSIGGFHSRAHVYQDVIATIKLTCLYETVEIEEPKASYRIHGSKLGAISKIDRWCEDSLEILEVMCTAMPEHSDYFRSEGRRLLCARNYRRAARVPGFQAKLRAYAIVYWKFREPPLQLFGERLRNRLRRLGARRFRRGAGAQV